MTGGEPGLVVAAFDFDGTLTRRDTLLPFLGRVAGRWAVAAALGRRGVPLAVALARGGAGRDREKAVLLQRVLAHREAARLEQVAEDLADDLVPAGLRPEALHRLADHLEAGDEVVVVSASPEVVVGAVARRIGVEHVLATRLEVVDGRLTGRLAGTNVRGAEKVARLDAWLAGRPCARRVAYGDSAGDRHLLAWADEPVWVGRRARRRAAGHGPT